MPQRRFDLYSAFLHCALVALAVLTARLAYENHQLKQPPEVAQLEIGASVEAVPVQTLAGSEQTLGWASQDAKERLLLVFTTTCPACKENQTTWRALYEQVGGSVEVVGISLDQLEATRAYRQVQDLPFPVVIPRDPEAFTQGYEISAVPLTLHIGGDGRVKGSWLGALTAEQLTDLTRHIEDRST
ncbi:MAG: TlpA disulfide reductase family protein, partial [Acidobacteriota bacterium]